MGTVVVWCKMVKLSNIKNCSFLLTAQKLSATKSRWALFFLLAILCPNWSPINGVGMAPKWSTILWHTSLRSAVMSRLSLHLDWNSSWEQNIACSTVACHKHSGKEVKKGSYQIYLRQRASMKAFCGGQIRAVQWIG